MTHLPSPAKSSSMPELCLGDLCELQLGVQHAPLHDASEKLTGASLAGMPIMSARVLFLEKAVAQRFMNNAIARCRSQERFRPRQGDIFMPMVARTLRARLVDSTLEGCVPTHKIAVLRPGPGAPSASSLRKIFSSKDFLDAAVNFATARLGNAHRLLVRKSTGWIGAAQPGVARRRCPPG